MKKIVIQGLGYVGLAMMTFCAGAKKNNKYLFNVVGVEKNSNKGLKIVNRIKTNEAAKIVDDRNFFKFFKKLNKDNRINASINKNEYSDADVIIVCSNCDFDFTNNSVKLEEYIKNINEISLHLKENCLVIIQSTLPPGTTSNILQPLIQKNLKKRGIKNFYLCHSFERITPGKDYYKSMKNVERIIGGKNKQSLKITKKIFKDIFSLTSNKIIEFNTTSESETCKIIENSYRATNIAFIEEWRKFCFANNLDLEKILDCIRMRKTHSNIMRSGIGVGGYCLTKDPLFGQASSKQIFKKKFNFPLSTKAVEVNQLMTSDILKEIKQKFNKNILGKKVILIGVSYREDTNDTRFTPAEGVYDFFKKMGCKLEFYDPIVDFWEYSRSNSFMKKGLENFDVYVYLIKHQFFKRLNIKYKKKSLILDLNHVINKKERIKINNNRNLNSYFIGSKQI
ncbi:nucleotide sugar dehydrogenase [Candidatus Pelagibacter bacterium nBUS_49]|uniref:nucleotide sugar dehydrogenase n=1 Tax=Candidatus Pelagibacter bacterium nBUS_49 TaxID=3374196 RepID=UPI003EB84E88